MPLMGSLYIGNSGLQTSQNALNTTAHNMTNADTTGYVRQQVQQGTKVYNTIRVDFKSVANQQIGLGVDYTKVKQIRDYFLDQTYRRETGRNAFYEVASGALEEIESLLDELNGESFQESLEGVWTAIQELSKDPSNAVTQGLLVQKSSQFIERAKAVYNGMCDYQDNLNQQIKGKVDTINKYADRIKLLNDEILKIECGGIERANDLRDERNRMLDELSAMAKISYSEDINGQVNVQLEGVDLVKKEVVYEIGLQQDEKTGFYTPFWVQNAEYTLNAQGEKEFNIEGAEVFNLNVIISSDLNTDIGSLKSMLLARGDHRADYTDIKEENYDYSVSQSVIMNVQGEFDQLIHNIVTTINGVLVEAANAAIEKGSGYMQNEDAERTPIVLFEKIGAESYEKVDIDSDGDGVMDTYKWVESTPDESKNGNKGSLFSIANIMINKDLIQVPTKLGFIKDDKTIDYETMEIMKAKFVEESNTLNPKVKKKTNFVDYYGDLVSQVANSGSVYKGIMANQQATVNATFNAREQVIGVSSDDELTAMIKYQNAYNASSRYINVISEMLAHIINTLGT